MKDWIDPLESMLMQSLPNSGSTWFGRVIDRALPQVRYFDKEFFNPACNPDHSDLLAKEFGSEMLSSYRNIAWPGGPEIHGLIADLWGRYDYTFTKEVFSPAKTLAFLQHFQVFMLFRTASDCFPPSRSRVWSFYEHAYAAYVETGQMIACPGGLKETCIKAHEHMQHQMLKDAARFGVPIIQYEVLMTSDRNGVEREIERVFGPHAPKIANQVIRSRQNRKHDQ